MRSVYLFVLMCLLPILGTSALPSELILTYQSNDTTTFRQKLSIEEIPSLRDWMESLLKTGSMPIILEEKNDVVWLYLNDPCGRGYDDIDFESDYFEAIKDLFPLKLSDTLKKILEKGNKSFIKALGIDYRIEDKEVISIIDYNIFEEFIL